MCIHMQLPPTHTQQRFVIVHLNKVTSFLLRFLKHKKGHLLIVISSFCFKVPVKLTKLLIVKY